MYIRACHGPSFPGTGTAAEVRSQFSRSRNRKGRSQFTRSRNRKERSRYCWSRSSKGAVLLCSEPEPVFGPGTGSGTEFIKECISISALNTIQFMKKSEPTPRRPEPTWHALMYMYLYISHHRTRVFELTWN